jgi:hypothetical protein
LAVPGTDFHAVVHRRIAVTPIHLDLTGRRLLRRLKTWSWELPKAPPDRIERQRKIAPKPPGRARPAEKQERQREHELVEEATRERR